jgi:Uma2 family endonuclease
MPTLVIPTDAPLLMGPAQGHWAYAHWEALPDDGNRYEIIDGVLYVSKSPSTFHQWIVFSLIRYLGVPATEQGLAYVLPAPVGVLMPGCDPVQPDLVVVRRERAGIIYDRRIRGIPDLIVEVLSPGNAQYDLQVKLVAYAAAGLPEYAVVDPAARALTHYRLAAPGRYEIAAEVGEEGRVTFDCLPAISLAVGALFASAPDTTL